MNPEYSLYTHAVLVAMRSQLVGLIEMGEDYPDVRKQLKDITEVLAKRRYELRGIWDDKIVTVYDLFRSEEDARTAAERMGLPIGGKFTLATKEFKTEIRVC